MVLLARRLVAGVSAVLIAAIVIRAPRVERGHAEIKCAALLAGGLLLAEVIIGILMLNSFAPLLLAAYVAAAAGLWAVLVVLVVLAGLATSGEKDDQRPYL